LELFPMLFLHQHWWNPKPPNFLIYSNASPNVKITEEEGVGACSLVCNTSGVKGVLEFQDGD
jgi:hypothetical protein